MVQLFGKFYDHRKSDSVAANLRQQRLSLFISLIDSLPSPIKILDLGGRVSFWEKAGFLSNTKKEIEITVLNISSAEAGDYHPRVKQIIGDAKNLEQFQDKEFDVVFSNSVIEHVGDYQEQRCMANEVMRVGKSYFIQTPNLYFPIEPHFLFPFFQFLPLFIRVWLVSNFSLGWYGKASDKNAAKNLATEIRLLSKKELTNLFPKAKLYEEKFLGLTKSLVAYTE